MLLHIIVEHFQGERKVQIMKSIHILHNSSILYYNDENGNHINKYILIKLFIWLPFYFINKIISTITHLIGFNKQISWHI